MKKIFVIILIYLLADMKTFVFAYDLSDYDIESADGFLNEEYYDFDFSDIVSSIYSGENEEAGLGDKLFNILLKEIKTASNTVWLCIGIIAAGAVFKSMTEVFNNTGISSLSALIVYSSVATLLLNTFRLMNNAALETVLNILDFMYALFPTFFCTVAFTKGNISAALLYQFTGSALGAVNMVLVNVLFPMVNYFTVLSIIDNAFEKSRFKTMCTFIKKLIIYINRFLIGAILSMTAIKSITIPIADTVKNTFIKKSISVIPGIGTGASAIADTLVSCGNIIKNTIGIAGIVMVFLIMAVPFIKLFAVNLLINFMGAVMEPIAGKRLINGIKAISEGLGLIMYVTGTGALTLICVIGLLCIMTKG